jgi:hypothetical protein
MGHSLLDSILDSSIPGIDFAPKNHQNIGSEYNIALQVYVVHYGQWRKGSSFNFQTAHKPFVDVLPRHTYILY